MGMDVCITREVVALKQLTATQLRARYLELYGEPARSGNKDYLWKRIVWRMQSQAEGDLSERARHRAAELANDADLRVRRPPDKPALTTAVVAALVLSSRSRFDSLGRDAPVAAVPRSDGRVDLHHSILASGLIHMIPPVPVPHNPEAGAKQGSFESVEWRARPLLYKRSMNGRP